MKKFLSILFIVNLCTGCATQGWKYTSEPKNYKKPESSYSLVVPPLRDARDSENSMTGYFISMLPLVPYGTSTINVPDLRMNAKPVEDFSKAIAEEIDSASIFKSSAFSYSKTGADLYLVGTLKSSQHIFNSTFYGLTPLGDLLWIVGLPAGKYYFNIEIEYKLLDNEDNVYFSKAYVEETSNIVGLYYGMGEYSFEETLKKISLNLVQDLNMLAPTLKIKGK